MNCKNPLYYTLEVVRNVLDLNVDAPILLAVDELIKLKKEIEGEDITKYLRFICEEMDRSYVNDVFENRDRTFWLSVSAYGCLSLTNYITDSNRDKFTTSFTNFPNHT